ncbi:MAG: DNA polymerase/3'-5' exonuclease PolX [Deferrisomatales bacterium]
MAVRNAEVAALFSRLADLLEIDGANPFRVRAYRNAARTLEGWPRSIEEMVRAGEPLSELPGIGADLAAKIEEVVRTGRLEALEEVRRRVPESLEPCLRLPGLGPKRVGALYRELGVRDLDGLRRAAEAGRIRALAGFGEKTERLILEALDALSAAAQRVPLAQAERVAEGLRDRLLGLPSPPTVEVAGSYRRRRDTVGDLDLLATCPPERAGEVMERFVTYGEVARVAARGTTRSTILLRSGLQVDLRVVEQESYGAALHYFTGSQAHNIAVRRLGQQRGLKINEYGVFRGDRRVGGRTEEEVYAAVGLPFIPPELREDRGEIEAAQAGRLPRLLTREDLLGDLHVHTRDTDGLASLEEMVEAAQARGYRYLAITNHSRRVAVARGYDAKRLLREGERIDRLNGRLRGFRVLKSIEVDILEDGSLDLPDEVLAQLDLTVCSVHYGSNLPRERQTERILRAMDSPYFHILAHPTGRLLGRRPPYEVDLERLLRAARERGCFVELNAHPERLDLDDRWCRRAKELGVKVAVSTDAHSVGDLDLIRFGVDQARRGWLEPDDVLNTRPWEAVRRLLRTP